MIEHYIMALHSKDCWSRENYMTNYVKGNMWCFASYAFFNICMENHDVDMNFVFPRLRSLKKFVILDVSALCFPFHNFLVFTIWNGRKATTAGVLRFIVNVINVLVCKKICATSNTKNKQFSIIKSNNNSNNERLLQSNMLTWFAFEYALYFHAIFDFLYLFQLYYKLLWISYFMQEQKVSKG